MKSYKGYKEMTRCVLEARDSHLKKKRRNQVVIRRCIPVISSFCFAAILGFGFWKHISKMSEIESKLSIVESTTTELSATEKKASNMHNNENSTTQKTTERSTTQNITSNYVSTDISHDISSAIAHTEIVNTTTNSEINEVPTELYIDYTAPTEKESAYESVSVSPTIDEDDGCTDNHSYLHWDEMAINQQYFMADFRELRLSYSTAEMEVPADDVGDYICVAFMSGSDWYELIYYHCDADAYKINGDNEMKAIAIKFANDEKYYLYTINEPNNADEPDG